MKSFAVRVLGDFAVDGVEPQALGSRKARLLLRMLALGDGRVVAAPVLADTIWGDSPPASPEDQLSVLVSRLRSVIGRERIEHRDDGYVLHCDWLDTAELAALTGEVGRRGQVGNVMGAAAAARIALSLIRGTGGESLSGDWARSRIAEIERLTARARLTAATALLRAGDWMAAADAASAALDLDPYDEAALRVLLRAQMAGGQPAAALATYNAARERLAAELGADPSPETTAVFTAILRGELAGPPRTTADAEVTAMVGRDSELAYLDAIALRARAGPAQLAVVEGEAGIGKTTLLRAWQSRRLAAGDMVLMAACGQLDRESPLDALLRAIKVQLRRLGPEETSAVLGQDEPLLDSVLGRTPPPLSRLALADSTVGPAMLYAAVLRVLMRLRERAPLVLIIDDAQLAGPALHDWLQFVRHEEDAGIAIVAAVRSGEAAVFPVTSTLSLQLLDLLAVTEMVGPARANELFERSRGLPLFLTELTRHGDQTQLPASLVESVSARCDALGSAGALLRSAAIIGPELDLDLLAAVLGRSALDLLDEAEQAVAKQLLAEHEGVLRFRHELVRDALAASATSGRQALLHRQAGRVLAQRPGADPAVIAYHARMGGDLELAASALCDAAALAAERFDHTTAESLLDDALTLAPDPQIRLARARVRTRSGRYSEALDDVEQAASAGPAALEAGAWAAYFGRRFQQAIQFASDGALAATDAAVRARCLMVGGRTSHAAGQLDEAERLLTDAFASTEGNDRVTAAAWLGVLRSHQSRVSEALGLLRPAARGTIGADNTAATLHSMLFLGHAHALAGQPALALEAFSRYTAEVGRRQVPRFAGRAVNFAGWVLRNLGAGREAREHHEEALEIGRHDGTPDLPVAALEDLAEQMLDSGELTLAATYLAEAHELLSGDLVFGWRLELKHDCIAARIALQAGDANQSFTAARDLEARAAALGVPRYVSVARLIAHQAGHALGEPADLDAVTADLDLLDRSVALESWRWTGELAAAFGVPAWLDRAANRAERLAGHAGPYADVLRGVAAHRLDQWTRAAEARH